MVIAGALNGQPAPALRGVGLGVTLAVVDFAATMAAAIRDSFPARRRLMQVAVIAAMGAGGVALAGLQPHDATALAAGAAVWMAVARLDAPLGWALGAAITVGLDLATSLAGSSAAAVLADTLLCALLGLMAHFMKQARQSQDRTEILLAELDDARAEQTRAAAIAERGRIAGELHDVLAHSLSAAAIQLQGARRLAEREQAEPALRAAVERAGELVREGLADARQAVGALRGQELPGVAHLGSLVDNFKGDVAAEARLEVRGDPRPLPADTGLALYRGAQEALTNVARYAPGASTVVRLSYEADRTDPDDRRSRAGSHARCRTGPGHDRRRRGARPRGHARAG